MVAGGTGESPEARRREVRCGRGGSGGEEIEMVKAGSRERMKRREEERGRRGAAIQAVTF